MSPNLFGFDQTTLNAIAVGLTAVASAIGGAWAWAINLKRKKAENQAAIAEDRATGAIYDAQQTVYKLLTDNMSRVELELIGLRTELQEERNKYREMELKLARLVAWIRAQNLTPPDL